MTPRDRHETIINGYATERQVLDVLLKMLSEKGLSILNDEAVREMATRVVSDHKRVQEFARQSRERAA